MQNFSMIDIGAKEVTARRAVARGTIQMSSEAFRLLADGKLPKGDVLAMAEIAGVIAAKNASQHIPLCHPLSLDYARVSFELRKEAAAVDVFCEAAAHAKTGVEMEALAGVQGALITIYDLTKGADPALVISDVRLCTKEGGKRGFYRHPLEERE